MKDSIRFRFTLYFIGMMALVLAAIWGTNNWLLESFYMNEKLKVMEDAYQEIDGAVKQQLDEGESVLEILTEELKDERMAWEQGEAYESQYEVSLLEMIREYGESNNISIALVDSITGTAILSSSKNGDFLAQKVQHYILGQRGKGGMNSEVLRNHENYTVEKNFDPRIKGFYMESWGFFSDNQTLFIMSMPLASIRESVLLSNRFLSYVGLGALIIASALIYIITKNVTSPILKLAALSERMCNLDFDARYIGNAKDEIGVLGHSMNILSEKLKTTIGELKSANHELQRDIEEKIQVDEMRKDFIANVSHELKTPIALIQGYAEGLTEGMCEDAESRDYYCEVIMDEANKMNKMVRQLLNLTALEFGNDAPSIERFDVTDLIRQVVASADILIQQSGVGIEFSDQEPVYVWADEFKIEEVVTNYLSNALNHVDGERMIRICVDRQGQTACVRVFNTGNTIDEEDLPNLWTKFYKVDKARTREYGGSGIGLSIVKAIMDAHHQECGVENKENGVEFWFTLDCGDE